MRASGRFGLESSDDEDENLRRKGVSTHMKNTRTTAMIVNQVLSMKDDVAEQIESLFSEFIGSKRW